MPVDHRQATVRETLSLPREPNMREMVQALEGYTREMDAKLRLYDQAIIDLQNQVENLPADGGSSVTEVTKVIQAAAAKPTTVVVGFDVTTPERVEWVSKGAVKLVEIPAGYQIVKGWVTGGPLMKNSTHAGKDTTYAAFGLEGAYETSAQGHEKVYWFGWSDGSDRNLGSISYNDASVTMDEYGWAANFADQRSERRNNPLNAWGLYYPADNIQLWNMHAGHRAPPNKAEPIYLYPAPHYTSFKAMAGAPYTDWTPINPDHHFFDSSSRLVGYIICTKY